MREGIQVADAVREGRVARLLSGLASPRVDPEDLLCSSIRVSLLRCPQNRGYPTYESKRINNCISVKSQQGLHLTLWLGQHRKAGRN